MIGRAAISSFCILGEWPQRRSLQLNLVAQAGQFAPPFFEPVPGGLLSTDMFCDLASDLRRIPSVVPAAAGEELTLLQTWACIAQDTRGSQLVRCSRSEQPADLIEQVLLADVLRADTSLHYVLETAARILLPPALARDVVERLKENIIVTKGALSRSRFLIDSAFMLVWRDLNEQALAGRGSAWYLMTDSSPQFGRDYQMTLIRRIRKGALPTMFDAFIELYQLWPAEYPLTTCMWHAIN